MPLSFLKTQFRYKKCSIFDPFFYIRAHNGILLPLYRPTTGYEDAHKPTHINSKSKLKQAAFRTHTHPVGWNIPPLTPLVGCWRRPTSLTYIKDEVGHISPPHPQVRCSLNCGQQSISAIITSNIKVPKMSQQSPNEQQQHPIPIKTENKLFTRWQAWTGPDEPELSYEASDT